MKKLLLAALLTLSLPAMAAVDELEDAKTKYLAALADYQVAAGEYYEILAFSFEVEATWRALEPVAMTILYGQKRDRELYLEIDKATRGELAVRIAGLKLAKVRAADTLSQSRAELETACMAADGVLAGDNCQISQ